MILVLLLLCCVCGNYGETIETSASFKNTTFKVNITNNQGNKNVSCQTTPMKVSVKEGNAVRMLLIFPEISGQQRYPGERHQAHKASCRFKLNTTGRLEVKLENNEPIPYLEKKNVKQDEFGEWQCRLGFNKDTREDLPVNDDGTTDVYCDITVEKDSELPEEPKPEPKSMDIKVILSIAAGVGVVVLLIIIAQAIALCYFRRKVNPQRRMDKLAKRSRFGRSDQARYSAPPSRKNSKANARSHADTDSHIYEMVGVNALYNGSHQFKIDENTNTLEKSIKDRPPLPLPHEIPEPAPPIETLPRRKPSPMQSMASTLSLNSIGSCSTLTGRKGKEPPGIAAKKAPARPPKPAEDIPGSLKRPPKTSVAAKTGSIPKMHATDPAMIELKNAMRLRNIGNDSPSSTPTSTLEKKPPVQAKPNKKTLKQEPPKNSTLQKPPPGGINPLAPQQNQIKLILPKIEESLKQNLAKTAPKPTQDAVKPIPPPPVKKTHLNQAQTNMFHAPPQNKMPNMTVAHNNPVSPMNPSPAMSVPPSVFNRPLPTPHQPVASHMNPMSQLPQNRPLPAAMSHVPVSHVSPSVLNRPLPSPLVPVTSRPLPPDPEDAIYHAPDEDLPPDDDEDDDEWTYEQLGQYNIYNI